LFAFPLLPFMTYLRLMKIIFAVLFTVLFCACNTDVCNQKTAWPAQVGMYTKTLLAKDSLTMLDSVSAWALDKALFYKNLKLNKMELPLSILCDSSVFVLQIKSTKDTVKIMHSNTTYFMSKQCGYGSEQVIDTVFYTTHKLKSITLSNAQADKNDKQNLAFHY